VDIDDRFNFRLAPRRAPSPPSDAWRRRGEFDVLYAVRKRRGRWTICADDNVVLQFETYDEAVATVRGAVAVLEQRSSLHDVPQPDLHSGATPPPAPSHDDGAQSAATPEC